MKALRRWLYRHGCLLHTICDDEDGRYWRYGQAIFHFFAGDPEWGDSYRERCKIAASWCLRIRNTHALMVRVGGGDSDREVLLHIEVFGLSWFLSFDGLPRQWCERILPGHDYISPWDQRVLRITQEVSTGLRWFEGALWWECWASDDWGSTDPRWQRWTFHPADFILGRESYQCEVLSTHEGVPIPLPEGSYEATVQLQRCTWNRPRWPAAKVRRLANIKATGKYAAIPGKGENSWDIDDDAILSMSCSARTVPEAVAAYVGAVLRDRERYGGSIRWQPAVPE